MATEPELTRLIADQLTDIIFIITGGLAGIVIAWSIAGIFRR